MIDVYVKYEEGRATLNFTAKKKEWALFFECDHPDHIAPVVYDFAAFACLTIADRFKQNVKLHAPVTPEALENCRALASFYMRMGPNDEIFEVTSDEIVTEYPSQGHLSSLCVSTGVDSTYALITEKERLKFTHGLVVHGADYAIDQIDGFNALLKRVQTMCGEAALEPIVVATNLREIGFNWEKLHVALLAACMHFLGPKFSNVTYSADNSIAEDMLRPKVWGNNYFVGTHISGGQTNAHYVGYEVSRYAKVKTIQRNGTFLDNIGVCYSNSTSGWNCGSCWKCIHTRIAMGNNGDKIPNIFHAMPDIVTSLDVIKIGKGKPAAIGIQLRLNEIISYVSNPAIKEAVIRLRKRAGKPVRFSQRTKRRMLIFTLCLAAILLWFSLK